MTSELKKKLEKTKVDSKEATKESCSKSKEVLEYESHDIEELHRLFKKYKIFLQHLDHRNMLNYGALFKQLFIDFKLDDEHNDNSKIDRSMDDLAILLEKACEKLNFDIYNASMKQLLKLYSILMEKLKYSKKLREVDLEKLELLLYRMYSDEEVLDILDELEEKKINPHSIEGINVLDQIVFTNGSTLPLFPSNKFNELINIYAEIN